MQITTVRIQNFRSIKDLTLQLEPTTVFIGANNAGKSAVVDAVRIALTRRWGRRGTGFTEHDLHADAPGMDPKTLPPVTIDLKFEERDGEAWPEDLVSDLDQVVVINSAGKNMVWLQTTCGWDAGEEAYTPSWRFLNADGDPLSAGAQRANNLNAFFKYPHFFWLDALRDAQEEFGARAPYWNTLLRAISIPKAIEDAVRAELDAIDTKVVGADPKFAEIASALSESISVAPSSSPGDVKLRLLPLNMWDMISRTAVILQMEKVRPWLPLGQHGQGLKSLAVVYLFQAAMRQKLIDDALPGAEPILGIEEPETHLHPQAARTLWGRLSALVGQKLVTSHSPQFIQKVPLHAIRMVRFRNQTIVSRLPRSVSSALPWTPRVQMAFSAAGSVVRNNGGTVEAVGWLGSGATERLEKCWGGEADEAARKVEIQALRSAAKVLVTPDEEDDLAIAGRRLRGEIFFARRWGLVEGQSEYLLLHAMGEALDFPLDQHGVAVIDFQNNGNPGIYASLAEAFGFEWSMVVDGDAAGDTYLKQLLEKGFSAADLGTHVAQLTKPYTLEQQLMADGHGALMRTILKERGVSGAAALSDTDVLARLGNMKIACMTSLAAKVSKDSALAVSMPAPLVKMVQDWKTAP